VDTVVAGFLNRDSVKHARFLVRRLKRAKSALRVGIVFWSEDGDDKKTAVELANDINADFVAYGMVEAVLGALSSDPPVALKIAAKRRMRRRLRPAKKAPLAAAK
ncbi:MAG: AI-2E family transporter, partial [Mesorhizobium sp.]